MSHWSERLPLNEETVKRYVAPAGGVYRLICSKGNGDLVFFVGSSANLLEDLVDLTFCVTGNPTLQQHLQKFPTHFRFYPTDDALERSKVEEIEIDKWRPACNRAAPPPQA